VFFDLLSYSMKVRSALIAAMTIGIVVVVMFAFSAPSGHVGMEAYTQEGFQSDNEAEHEDGQSVDPGDAYILKSEIVPPVCPVCPQADCPRQRPCPPCPPCARCPEPQFECKKVPNFSSTSFQSPSGLGLFGESDETLGLPQPAQSLFNIGNAPVGLGG